MKRKLIVYLIGIVLIFLLGASTLFQFKPKEEKQDNITLAEVAHTIFYAPLYVSIENGYFKNHGIDLELILTSGADKVVAAVLSGDADIGFSGSEATIYVYQGGEKDYLKTFSQLTQKDGTFLVSRKKIDHFSLKDVKGKTIIGGRSGGMPEMTLEYILKQNGINPREDVSINTSIEFASMGSAFIGGEGDFVSLFEPTATKMEQEGYGYVVASIGQLGGVVPYTSFSARQSYIEANADTIKRFDQAIQEGLDYVHSHTPKEIAKVIEKQFPDTGIKDIESAVERYQENDTWPQNTTFTKESFDHLQEIMIDYGQIKNKVSYQDLFYLIQK